MNRLKEASYDGRSESFTYDKVGNRLTKTTNDITEKYVYNVKNQLKELHNNSVINHFTYDKQGNTIKEETTTGNNIFEYNTLNQQVKAVTKEGNTLVSRYDTEGLRAEIEENEKLTKFIFHKENILVEADKDFNVISRFTRGYEVVAADIAEANEGSEFNLNRYYYTTDEQGSTVFITDKDHQVKNEYYYDAFGNVLEAQEEVHNRITYTGQQYDSITQQYYLRARFYNPVIGRFTQEDVYRGDGLNLYAYCGNNPVGYYDPSGYAGSVTYTNRDIILDGKKIGTVNYKTGEYLDISIDREVLRNLNNQLGLAQISDPELRKAFSLNTFERGKQIENIIANNVKNQYMQIGDGLNGKFPIIDLGNANSVVSIKSMNVYSNCYAKTDSAGEFILDSNGRRTVDVDKVKGQLEKYYDAIDNVSITVNDEEVEKILDVEINKNAHAQGLKDDIEKSMTKYCEGKGTTLHVR
ncbi:RHS repeat-associated core domain-containing protein [uncultured Clostridium sp.]|uniref:RHS repeat-associated core domain-containing protein n=1 Tax=uncultured Clostridium sp. TaxID=59620 RepID=UPI0028EC170E|nr:RHS repeat-associated core domain-containing protein [uncultured Clostridium sp.]